MASAYACGFCTSCQQGLPICQGLPLFGQSLTGFPCPPINPITGQYQLLGLNQHINMGHQINALPSSSHFQPQVHHLRSRFMPYTPNIKRGLQVNSKVSELQHLVKLQANIIKNIQGQKVPLLPIPQTPSNNIVHNSIPTQNIDELGVTPTAQEASVGSAVNEYEQSIKKSVEASLKEDCSVATDTKCTQTIEEPVRNLTTDPTTIAFAKDCQTKIPKNIGWILPVTIKESNQSLKDSDLQQKYKSAYDKIPHIRNAMEAIMNHTFNSYKGEIDRNNTFFNLVHKKIQQLIEIENNDDISKLEAAKKELETMLTENNSTMGEYWHKMTSTLKSVDKIVPGPLNAKPAESKRIEGKPHTIFKKGEICGQPFVQYDLITVILHVKYSDDYGPNIVVEVYKRVPDTADVGVITHFPRPKKKVRLDYISRSIECKNFPNSPPMHLYLDQTATGQQSGFLVLSGLQTRFLAYKKLSMANVPSCKVENTPLKTYKELPQRLKRAEKQLVAQKLSQFKVGKRTNFAQVDLSSEFEDRNVQLRKFEKICTEAQREQLSCKNPAGSPLISIPFLAEQLLTRGNEASFIPVGNIYTFFEDKDDEPEVNSLRENDEQFKITFTIFHHCEINSNDHF